eukprot:XP_011670353.1 PREDICTED: uncharacterized protein LOC105441166 [Strongylocentrotus purpuratus]
MATRSPKKSTTKTATIHNTVLNTPKVRMIPQNNATNVLHRASFSMSPVEQKKLKPATPRGLLAMRATIAEMNLELPTSLLTAHGQLSPSSLTPEVTIIGYSPPRAPVVRRLRRQNAVIEGVTTSRGTRRPPSPATSSVQMEVDVPEKSFKVSRNSVESSTTRRRWRWLRRRRIV